jgi:signal peptidase II
MSLKETLYDWNGTNEWLFLEINSIQGEYYDKAMVVLSSIADHHLFPYYMAALAFFAVLSYGIRKITKSGNASHTAAVWFGILAVLVAGYLTEGFIIGHAKNYFSYPRPYMALSHDTRVLGNPPQDDSYHSFPSGHTGFIILMIVGLWPILSSELKLAGAVLIPAVMWSRMALGMHFPADVTWSFIIFLPLILAVRAFVYRVLRGGFGIKC